jgi:putative transcriptional regulator
MGQHDHRDELVAFRERSIQAMKNRVEELREEREWTKVDLGDRLGVSRQTIHAIETGRYDPSLPLALAIAKLFGKAVEDIFGDDAMGKNKKR